MHIQLIRSATIRLTYAGHTILIDPYLAARFSRPSYTGRSPNPLVELPCTPQEAIAGTELVLISHLHSDHFDPAACDLLPKELPILCQPQDGARLVEMGFQDVRPLVDPAQWQGITIARTPCQHGSGKVLAEMGEASGFVLRAPGEPTVYWAGDTVWFPGVANTIARERPDVIVTHSCGAMWGEGVLILLDAAQTAAVCQAAPWATVVATHMEALDHATVTRQALREYVTAQGIGPERLRIPADGETVDL
jgi:L-ascorbate metabolism protein UlaG (beta-lactamase superfamily)